MSLPPQFDNPGSVRLQADLSSLRRSFRNAASISAYEKLAFRPLGFGSTNTCGALECHALGAKRHGAFGAEDPSIQRHADERDDLGLEAAHLRAQQLDSRCAFLAAQRVDARRFARDEIGDAEAPFRQPVVGAPVDGSGTSLDSKRSFQNRLE